MPLFELALQALVKVALDGGCADVLPTPEAAAVDAVEMLLVDGLLVGFAGSLEGKDAGEPLSEIAAASAAMPLGNLQFEDAGAQSPVLVADVSQVAAFVSKGGGVAVGAGDGPCVADVETKYSRLQLHVGNPVVGQAEQDL